MDLPKWVGYPVLLVSMIRYIENIHSNEDFKQQYGKPNDIAQALVYTIPYYYSPKMGGIEFS